MIFKNNKSVSECYDLDKEEKVITLDDIIGSTYEDTEKEKSLSKKEEVNLNSPAGMKEIKYHSEEENQVKFIENPLPVPKRKEHKAIDFDINDIGDDDFDLHDMTGIDFFDIE